ncbi:MAG: ABC transporter substrate-binding protein, partial [Acidimicrobiales bacterium]
GAASDGGGLVLGEATGELTVGSNYSNALPQAGLAAAVAAVPNENITGVINEVDHNTFQENITTYLQQPDDIIPWFAGYRMRFFAAQDLLGDITDVWGVIGDQMSDGFKQASTGDDGKQYLVPWSYYAWGVYYRKSLFEENGYEIPTDLAGLTTLAEAMSADGLTPFAFGNDGQWPAMGTFDQINFRLHGYQFHVDLMAGKEPWNGDQVKETFNTFADLLPLHQDNPNGRTWEEAAAAVVNKEAGMMTIGTFIGSQFPEDEFDDIDFFPFPALSDEHGLDTIEAPIDGWMMAKSPKNEAAAKEMLAHFGTGLAQDAYLAEDPSVVATSSEADTSVYNDLQRKVQDAVANAASVTQFLDRDTSPEFASNVAGPRIADFLADPTKLDSILDDMEEQAGVILRN